MNNKKNYNKSLQLNQNSDYYLMNDYGDIELGSDVFNSDLTSMDNNIDYEKDDFFDSLKRNNNFYFNKKTGFTSK